MERVTRQGVPLERVLKHPLSKEFLSSGYDKAILRHQMQDPIMRNITYDEIAEQGLRIFLHQLLKRAGEWENIRQDEENKLKNQFGVAREIDTEDNRITLLTNEDFTELKVILHKPLPDQERLTEYEIRMLLLENDITYGIKKEFILRLVENPVYEKRFKIAIGKKAKTGKDGSVHYCFDTEFNLAPKTKEDGVVDYRELNYAENVRKGALLCKITPPEKGEDGIMLNGVPLEGSLGKAVIIRAGKNTFWSADQTKLYASRDGSPHLENDVVEIREVLELKAVDFATGNIKFAGNVKVRGDVESGFTVEASGDIIVGGIVDGQLYADGNIILQNGVKGGGNAYLEAGKDIRAEFLENANVLCKGSISADAILNSIVVCWKNVCVYGRNGKIIGGKITAGEKIMADEIGNESNTPTSLIVEATEGELQHNIRVQEKIDAVEYMIKQVRLILENGEYDSDISRQIVVLRLVYVAFCLGNQVLDWKNEIENASRKNSIRRSVCAKSILAPNVSIKIEDLIFRNTSTKVEETTIRVSNGKMVRILGRGEINKI